MPSGLVIVVLLHGIALRGRRGKGTTPCASSQGLKTHDDDEEEKDKYVQGGGNEENASKIHKKLPTSSSKRPHTPI